MSHVKFNKALCCPLNVKKCSRRPVEFEKCPMSLPFSISDRVSLRPKMPHVALSVLGVYIHVYGHYGRETYPKQVT